MAPGLFERGGGGAHEGHGEATGLSEGVVGELAVGPRAHWSWQLRGREAPGRGGGGRGVVVVGGKGNGVPAGQILPPH